MKVINLETINDKNRFNSGAISKEEIEKALQHCIKQIDFNLNYYGYNYPFSCTKENKYEVIENIEWTNGFYTGMLWLAYEYTKDEKYKNVAMLHVKDYYNRILNRIEVGHHDLGFLYSPSCVKAYQLTKDPIAKEAALMAADYLIKRYQAVGEFIQAWGDLSSDEHYRFIVDCLLNIPLLYWATNETGNEIYKEIADRHYNTTLNYAVRDDASAFHTFYMDRKSGKPVRGITRQGYSDDSCWARGQAWLMYGIALNHKYNYNFENFDFYRAITNYYLNRLPKDHVAYWDLIFNDGSDQSRDSSSGAIAVCGMMEMNKYLPDSCEDKKSYENAKDTILKSLINNYTGEIKEGGPILYHGVYSWHSNKGVDEGNIWGDYYYMEALIRYLNNSEQCW